ncbi:hypothetical protein [Pseudorhodoferax sp.]|uniref:hypothetical protein n=1 Tax=Pseudorhodoferax sp. TaxID=1993553 RepID=UPI002DD6293C|nr:hypothetical protein [Pseudorhodoferax sp.]
MLRSLLLAGIAWTLAGCAPMLPEPRLASNRPVPGPVEFDGIDSLLANDRPLDVLLVHGMCSKDAAWAQQALADMAALVQASTQTPVVHTPLGAGGIELFQTTLETARGRVRANAVLWSPLTRPLKQGLCYDQSHKSAICTAPPLPEPAPAYAHPRASLNRQLKDELLNDCLADALAYQGTARQAITARMQEAVLTALDRSGGQPQASAAGMPARLAERQEPLVVITSSLGSKMVFDALLGLAASGDGARSRAAQNSYDRIATVFMRANQIPILALADTDLPAPAGAPVPLAQPSSRGTTPDPIAALEQRRQRPPPAPAGAGMKPAGVGAPGRLQLVAFTDPNDVLSYVLVPSPMAQAAPYRIVDVVLSTAPALLGLVASPIAAHQDYDTNTQVRRFIACGTAAACGLQAP